MQWMETISALKHYFVLLLFICRSDVFVTFLACLSIYKELVFIHLIYLTKRLFFFFFNFYIIRVLICIVWMCHHYHFWSFLFLFTITIFKLLFIYDSASFLNLALSVIIVWNMGWRTMQLIVLIIRKVLERIPSYWLIHAKETIWVLPFCLNLLRNFWLCLS